jgi:hypothetical protein
MAHENESLLSNCIQTVIQTGIQIVIQAAQSRLVLTPSTVSDPVQRQHRCRLCASAMYVEPAVSLATIVNEISVVLLLLRLWIYVFLTVC